jgi:hypothetical protein
VDCSEEAGEEGDELCEGAGAGMGRIARHDHFFAKPNHVWTSHVVSAWLKQSKGKQAQGDGEEGQRAPEEGTDHGMARTEHKRDEDDAGELHGMNTTERGGCTHAEVTRVMVDPSNGREAREERTRINGALVAMNRL